MSRPAVTQLAATWALGGLILPGILPQLAVLLFAGLGVVAIAALILGALLVGALWAVAEATASATALGATRGRRVRWAVLVAGVGTVLWRLGWVVTDTAGLRVSSNGLLTVVLGGVPFALVAGLLLRARRQRRGALAALVLLAAAGLVALRLGPPDDLTDRTAYAQLDRRTAYVVAVPGYRPSESAYGGDLGTGAFRPADPAAEPPLRQVTVVAYPAGTPRRAGCAGVPVDSHLSGGACTPEPGGLRYLRTVVEHGYVVPRGGVDVVVTGTPGVDRDLLRRAARTVRPATAKERGEQPTDRGVFAVDLPGYRAHALGMPPGLEYTPADHSDGPGSVQIRLVAEAGTLDQACFQATCTPDGDGLTYLRGEDTHGYLLARGPVLVHALGGLGVDRALLRRTALAARPATDAELRRALPLPPPHGLVGGLRYWLRQHT
ncbi:hypothetical protein [Micromonospora auratinigra]|uniref:Uncharacterized protein n=1 Tax=Micromonospora auratinigra TaxID=261654 RepID=A0A1A8ZCV9_9ACTN|nr:hypothetical protein [Micromonospora auratinigra]SBT41838.1 hypothetical protein GA0070611_1763 [Micromonospora auratinigra]